MVRIEVKAPPLGDLGRVRRSARPIERLAIEGRRWDKFCRRLAGIERSAARIAVDVDDRARKPRPHQCRAERRDEIVELVEPPIRVLAREPRIDEGRLERQQVRSRMGNADDERRVAALDDEPVGSAQLSSRGPLKSGQRHGADRINDGPAAHKAGRRGDVGMKVAVVFQARNLAPQQGPHSFERRA